MNLKSSVVTWSWSSVIQSCSKATCPHMRQLQDCKNMIRAQSQEMASLAVSVWGCGFFVYWSVVLCSRERLCRTHRKWEIEKLEVRIFPSRKTNYHPNHQCFSWERKVPNVIKELFISPSSQDLKCGTTAFEISLANSDLECDTGKEIPVILRELYTLLAM